MEPVTDPIRQLSVLAGEVVGLKDRLGEKVDALKSLSYHDANEREYLRTVLLAYERVLAQCHKLLSDMGRLDLDTRLVNLSEALADLIERVVEGVIESRELGLDRERQGVARGVLVKELARATGTA